MVSTWRNFKNVFSRQLFTKRPYSETSSNIQEMHCVLLPQTVDSGEITNFQEVNIHLPERKSLKCGSRKSSGPTCL